MPTKTQTKTVKPKAPVKIETRNDRRKKVQEAKTLKALKADSRKAARTLKARRNIEPERTENQQDKIVQLGRELGFNARSIAGRLRYATTRQEAQSLINTWRKEVRAKTAADEPSQALYVEDPIETWNLHEDEKAERLANKLSTAEFGRIAWLVTGIVSSLLLFAAGWALGKA